MKLRITVFLIFAFNLFCAAQDYSLGQCIYTRAYNGLNLRSDATLKSEVLTKLAIGAEVEIIDVEETQVDINGDLGYWLRVSNGVSEGYIFSAFTQVEPIFYYGKLCSNWQNIINGLKLNYTLVDSIIEKVDKSKSGPYRLRQYHYSSGMHEIEHIYNEKYETRYLIPTSVIDRSQFVNLLLAVFDYCDCLTEENKNEILCLSKKEQINRIEEFSSIYISESEDLLAIKLEGGP